MGRDEHFSGLSFFSIKMFNGSESGHKCMHVEQEQDCAAKRAEAFKALCSKGLELPTPSAPQEQPRKSWGLVTATPTTSGESSCAPTPRVPDLPMMHTGLMGELQLGQPWPNTLPL